jgi:virginiamycin B lyase
MLAGYGRLWMVGLRLVLVGSTVVLLLGGGAVAARSGRPAEMRGAEGAVVDAPRVSFTFIRDARIGTPEAIAVGADGALWFTGNKWGGTYMASCTDSWIGRVATTGGVSLFRNTLIHSRCPRAITPGPDGALWFTMYDRYDEAGLIGRITTSGSVRVYNGPGEWMCPRQIGAGHDGALWFTTQTSIHESVTCEESIGRLTTSGAFTLYGNTRVVEPFGIATAIDGSIWFTDGDWSADRIGRLTPKGAFVFYRLRRALAGSITVGPDGALWFLSDPTGDHLDARTTIGRLTTKGTFTFFRHVGADLSGLTAGSDGALWFTDRKSHSIGRIITTGAVTIYRNNGITTPSGITTGRDGTLWFLDGSGKVGRARILPGR